MKMQNVALLATWRNFSLWSGGVIAIRISAGSRTTFPVGIEIRCGALQRAFEDLRPIF